MAAHLSHGVRHGGHLQRLALHLPSERNGITVYVGAASHDGGPHPIRDPGAGPAQGHGAFGLQWVEPAAQAADAHVVVGCVGKVGGASGGVGGVQGLNVLHGQGLP